MDRPNLRSVATVVAFGVLALSSSAAPADQSAVRVRDGGTAHVVNGVTSGFYPAVGALLLGDSSNGRSWCSGTLIGCQTFITAAHCVCPTNGTACSDAERPNASTYTVFFQHAGFVGVDAIVVQPAYQFPHADLAIIKLSQPVAGIRPVPINTEASPPPDAAGTIVGFGSSGGGNADYGILRSGRVVVAEGMVGQGDGLLGWYFRGPMGDPGSNANTCSGDSGGPLLLESDDGWMLAGTTTGGQNGSCLSDDVSIDTDVFAYRQWISEVADEDLSGATCGDAQLGDDESIRRVFVNDTFDEGRPSAVHVVVVPPSTTHLRVTMNGVDDGRADFNLEVRAPDATTRCVQNGPSQFAVCEVTMPAAGAWEIRVDRVVGSGPYQINAATVSTDCGRPENEGQTCNDGNACTRDDVCQAGACRGGTRVRDDSACAPRTCSPTPSAACARSTALQPPLLTRLGRSSRQPVFTWRWIQSQRGTQIAYADPTAGTDYTFCVYDDRDRLVLQAPLRAGKRWYKYRRGFTYQDDSGGGAISHARLRTDTRSRTAILVKGRGLNPLTRVSLKNDNMSVRAQLQGGDGCWETAQMLVQGSE